MIIDKKYSDRTLSLPAYRANFLNSPFLHVTLLYEQPVKDHFSYHNHLYFTDLSLMSYCLPYLCDGVGLHARLIISIQQNIFLLSL